MPEITREMLRDFLTDALPDRELVAVEKAVREQPKVRALLDRVRQELDRGEHSIGAVWRRERLSCPTRDQLGGFILLALDNELFDYVEFHLTTIGCAFCQANLDDLKKINVDPPGPRAGRRRRIVDSSAGTLRDAARG